MIVRYLTHPQVEIDPDKPVPLWGLNAAGRARVQSVAASKCLLATRTIVSSAETKALETAQPFAEVLGLQVITREAMHENDRSATGFLPPDIFETVADQFFANPQDSIRGWERAVDAQARIVSEVERALASAPDGDVLIVGHGGVGTLLMCHLGGWPIARKHDQKGGGGGNWFAFGRENLELLHGWQPMETLMSERMKTAS